MVSPHKILFAIPELATGGPDRVFYELVCGLDRTIFAPQLVVSQAGGRYFDALPADVEIYDLGRGRYPIRRFARAVDRLAPDLVISTLRMNVTAAAARALQRRKVPLIARQANAIAQNFSELRARSLVKHRIAEAVVKGLLQVPDALVAQSSDMARELRIFARKEQKIVVIGNPISLKDTEAKCKKQRSIGDLRTAGSPAIIAVGRLSQQKGFDLLLPAFSRFLQVYGDATLTIFGEGPERSALESQINQLQISHAVRMPGQSDQVLAEIAASDIFVSSSRYEGFSNAMLEAAALGAVIVATDCEGATKDIIRDGQTGILVDEISSDALLSGIIRSMSADRKSMKQAAKIHITNSFSRQQILRMYAELAQDLIGRGSLENSASFGATSRSHP